MRVIARTLILACALVALAACNSDKKAASNFDQDMTMGSAKAPVTMIEYASVTCPHCAAWNSEVFPAFKAKYIDTGKVHYVFRETLIHPELDVIGYRLARCVGPEKYFQVVDGIMRAQSQFVNTPPRDVFLSIAQSTGMSEADFNKCVDDEDATKKLLERTETERKEFNVQATPTFIINGKQVGNGEATLDELSAAIDPLLKK
jgi:protein-disulfide isomerase